MLAMALWAGWARAQAHNPDFVDRLPNRLAAGAGGELLINAVQYDFGDTIYIREQFTGGGPLGAPATLDVTRINVLVEALDGATVEDAENAVLTLVEGTQILGTVEYGGFITTVRRPEGFAPGSLSGNGTLDLRGRNTVVITSGPQVGGFATTETQPTLAATVARVDFIEEVITASTAAQAAEISGYKIGGRLFFRVDDDDRNISPAALDTVTVTLRDGVGAPCPPVALPAGQEIGVALTETGLDSGVFVGSIPTRFGAAVIGNGILEDDGAGNSVLIDYPDGELPGLGSGGRAAQRCIVPRTGDPTPASVAIGAYSPGVVIPIVVTDRAINVPEAIPTETVTVRVFATAGGDSETIVLGSQSGSRFFGGIRWSFLPSGAASVVENGVLTLPQGAGIAANAEYITLGVTGNPQTVFNPPVPVAPTLAVALDIDFVTDGTGLVDLPAGTPVSPADTLYVRVRDERAVTNPFTGTNNVSISVDAFHPGDATLRHRNNDPDGLLFLGKELATTPGTFVVPIPLTDTARLTVTDGTLHVRGFDGIGAAYLPAGAAAPISVAAASRPVVAVPAVLKLQEDPGAVALQGIDAAGEIRQIRAGQSFLIVVKDDDQNRDTNAVEVATTTQVTVTSGAEVDTQVQLTETGVDTGIFTGRLAVQFGGVPALGDGIIVVTGAGPITVRWDDKLMPLRDTASAVTAAVELTTGIDGAVVLSPQPTLLPGTTLNVTVVDTDALANARAGTGNDSVRVTLTSLTGAGVIVDTETVEVDEDSGNPIPPLAARAAGTFVAEVPVSFAGGVARANDGLLQVMNGGLILGTYLDALRASGQNDVQVNSNTVNVAFSPAAPALTFVNAAGVALAAPATLEPGDTVHVLLTDANANVSAGTDTINVTLVTAADRSPLAPAVLDPFSDLEVVTLVETGASTGVFRGSIDSKTLAVEDRANAVPLANNGQLEVRGRDFDAAGNLVPQVTASYSSPGGAGAAPVGLRIHVPGRVQIVDGDRAPASAGAQLTPDKLSSVTAGDLIFVRIFDDDFNRNPLAADVITVNVTSAINKTPSDPPFDRVTTVATETGPNTGVFTTLGIPTRYKSIGQAMNLADGFLDLNDTDVAGDPLGGGFVIAGYSDLERIVPTAAANDVAVPQDTVPVANGVNAVLITAPGSGATLNPGSDLSITVTDNDTRSNIRGGPGNDTITVTVRSFTGPAATGTVVDQEVFTIGESTFLPGTFSGRVPVAFVGTPFPPFLAPLLFFDGTRGLDGTIQVRAGGSIQVVFEDRIDALGLTPAAFPRTDAGADSLARISTINTAFAGGAPAPPRIVSDESGIGRDIEQIGIGDTLYLQVGTGNVTATDFDLSADVDSMRVTVTSLAGDREQVVLRETGPRTGIFTGRIETRLAPDETAPVVPPNPANNLFTVPPSLPNQVPGLAGLGGLVANGTLDVRGLDPSAAARQIVVNYESPSGVVSASDQSFANVDALVRFVENAQVPTTVIAGLGGNPTAPLPGQVTAIRAGDSAYVLVADDDFNTTATPDTVTVTLRSFINVAGVPTLLDTLSGVILTETGNNTGVFKAAGAAFGGTGIRTGIPTEFRTTGIVDAILQVAADAGAGTDTLNFVTVELPDTQTKSGINALPYDRVTIRKGTAGSITVVDRFTGGAINIGDDLTVTIGGVAADVDNSLNAGPGNDTITVSLTSFSGAAGTGNNADTETVVAREDPVVEGRFIAVVPTVLARAASRDNGALELVPGGSVLAEYRDFLAVTGQPSVVVQSVGFLAVNAAFVGQVTFAGSREDLSPVPVAVTRVAPGDTLYIRVDDRDVHPVLLGSTNTVTVTVTTPAGDAETVVLSETVNATGTFIGTLPTRSVLVEQTANATGTVVTPGNGNLEVRGRDTVTATYSDQNPAALRPNNTVLNVEFAGTVRAQGAAAADSGEIRQVTIGQNLCIRVVDDDRNTAAGTIETLTVAVAVASTPAEAETVTLTETGPDTGVFTGCVATRNLGGGGAVANDGIVSVLPTVLPVRVRANDIGIVYSDNDLPFPASGAALAAGDPARLKRTTVDALFGVVGAQGTGTITLSVPRNGVYTRPNDLAQVIGGAPLSIVVSDPDQAGAGTLAVTISVTDSNLPGVVLDQETINLLETSPFSGVFGPFNTSTALACAGVRRANVPTNFGPRVFNNCFVSVAGNEFVSVSYVDPLDAFGAATTVSAQAQVASRYLDEATATTVGTDSTTLNLSNGARLVIPPAAVYKPTDVKFLLRFGNPGSDLRPRDEANNPIPLPLNPAMVLVTDAGKAFWYEIQPSNTALRRPAQVSIPVPSTAQAGGAALSAQQQTQLRLVFFDGFEWISAGGTFVAVGSTAVAVPDPTQAYVVTTVNHFTTFALAVDGRTPPPAGGPLITSLAINNNPFTPNRDGINDTATISFGLAEASLVTIRIFDSSGLLVRTLVNQIALTAGFVSEQWNGSYQFADRHVPGGHYVADVRAQSTVTGRTARETILLGVVK
jgi:hypothetical protein